MNITEQVDQFIAENGGNTRDALNVALARLEAAEIRIAEMEASFDDRNEYERMRNMLMQGYPV